MQLTAPIINKNEEKRIVYGPVLVPGEKDRDGDVVSAEKIEEVAYDYMENYRIVDADHTIQKVAVPVESHLLREEKQEQFADGEEVTLPAGTWMMGARVKSDEQWERVKKGELTGFSIMAVRADETKAIKSGTLQSLKTTLEDLGEDFAVPAVSLVGHPAVPKGKYIAIKSKKAFDGLTISKEEIKHFCPECAEKMEKKGLDKLKLKDDGGVPLEALDGLCDSLGEEDGFFGRCMDHEVAQDMEDPEAFCAWLHRYCHDKWPAEENSANKELTEGYTVRQQIPDWPIASTDRTWDADEVDNRIRRHISEDPIEDWTQDEWDQYQQFFVVWEGEQVEAVGDTLFGYADVIDGQPHIVPAGVFAGAAILEGARGGTDLPESVQNEMRDTYETLYDRIDNEFEEEYEAPWNQDDAEKGITDQAKEKITKFFSRLVGKEGRVISDENLTMLQEVVDRLEQAENELNELLEVAYQERHEDKELTNFTFQEVSDDMDEEQLEIIVKEVEEATDNISETYNELKQQVEKMEDDDGDEIDMEELAKEVAEILKDDNEEEDGEEDDSDDVEKGSDEEEDAEENEDSDDDNGDNGEDKEELVKELKDKIEDQEDKIEDLKSKLNKSKALKDGEDDSKEKSNNDRDIFGRNRK